MKNYVVSFELAKQLKEAGWVKETEFIWIKDIYDRWFTSKVNDNNLENSFGYYPTPLTDELLEELPHDFGMRRYQDSWLFWIGGIPKTNINTTDTLSNALAKLWLELKQKGIIK